MWAKPIITFNNGESKRNQLIQVTDIKINAKHIFTYNLNFFVLVLKQIFTSASFIE